MHECTISGCAGRVHGYGLCHKHYCRKRKTGTTDDRPPPPTICRIPSCHRPHKALGFCVLHYKRKWKTGTPYDGPKARLPFEVRLWKKIDRRGPDECWPWVGRAISGGYGSIGIGGRGTGRMAAHRAVWEITNGPIPKGDFYGTSVIRHRCDRKLCCNPAHLEIGTPTDNSRDLWERGQPVIPRLRGSAHGMAILTEAKVRRIRASKKPTRELAAKYGVSIPTIHAIRSGRLWKHVT